MLSRFVDQNLADPFFVEMAVRHELEADDTRALLVQLRGVRIARYALEPSDISVMTARCRVKDQVVGGCVEHWCDDCDVW